LPDTPHKVLTGNAKSLCRHLTHFFQLLFITYKNSKYYDYNMHDAYVYTQTFGGVIWQ